MRRSQVLNYFAGARPKRLWKWARYGGVALGLAASLYIGGLGWLYWNWQNEQPSREVVARLGGAIGDTRLIGGAYLRCLVPERLTWIRERITCVYITDGRASDDDVKEIWRLSHLEELAIGDITDARLAQIGRLAKLRRLELCSESLTDQGIAALGRLSQLEELMLNVPQLSDSGVRELSRLPKLRMLLIVSDKVSDAGVSHLKMCSGMRSLDLYCPRITDAGLVQLEGMTGLERLAVESCNVTDASVVHLMKLRGLKELFLGPARISNSAEGKLRDMLPECDIVIWDQGAEESETNHPSGTRDRNASESKGESAYTPM